MLARGSSCEVTGAHCIAVTQGELQTTFSPLYSSLHSTVSTYQQLIDSTFTIRYKSRTILVIFLPNPRPSLLQTEVSRNQNLENAGLTSTMIQTQHLYSHQQYGQHDQPVWQHGNQQQSHQGLSHAQQQAQAAAAAQQSHYSRIAINQNHNTSHNQGNNNRQASGDNTQNNTGRSASGTNEQTSPAMEQQLSEENRKVLVWVAELMDPARREGALMELSKKREQVPELALILWHSFGVMTSLLQEIISVYPLLNPSQLTAAASNRVCNALALLQCVASHNETRGLFLNGTYVNHAQSVS